MAAICVYCASSTEAPTRYVDLAGEVGTALADRGHSLVSGGGAVSLMGAVARAARRGGAHTVGVIPQSLVAAEIADHAADELVVTADMRSRKALMEERSEAFLALPGGIGTLEELFEMWVARALRLHDKPVVVLDPDGVYDGLRAQVETLLELRLLRPGAAEVVTWTTTATQALDAIEAGLGAGAPAGARPPGPTDDEALEAAP